MKLGKAAAVHFGSQIVITISGFAATFVIATVLGSTDFGLYSTAVAIGFFWLAIPANGVAQAVKKRMSEGDEPGAFLGAGLVVNACIAIGLGTGVLAISWALTHFALPDVVLVTILREYGLEIATLLVGAVSLQTALAGLEGRKQIAGSGAMKAVDRVARSIVQISLIAAGFGVTAITFGHAAVLIFVAILAIATTATAPAWPTRRHLYSLFEYAKYAWVGALRGRVYGWLDVLVLSMFLSSASLIGIYELAWGIGSLLATASGSISTTLFPEVSELSVSDDYERIKHYLNEAIAYSGLIVIPGLVGAVVLGPRVLRFYRPEYVQGSTVLIILVSAYLADVYASQLLNVINAVDRPDTAMRVNTTFIIANVVFNLWLVWAIGWTGAAIATALSAGIRMVGGFVALRRLIGRTALPIRTLSAEVLAASIMALVVVPVDSMLAQGRLWTVLLVGLGAVCYFAGLLALSKRVRTKVRYIIGSFTPQPL
jgi:O-antigen/teichoic acid export membrane protein